MIFEKCKDDRELYQKLKKEAEELQDAQYVTFEDLNQEYKEKAHLWMREAIEDLIDEDDEIFRSEEKFSEYLSDSLKICKFFVKSDGCLVMA